MVSRRVFGVADARRLAKRRLPKVVYDFVEGGADDSVTQRNNRAAYEAIALRPRMAVRVARPDLSVSLFGQRLGVPFIAAPCGLLRLIHPDGEIGVARAATSLGTAAAISSMSGRSLEEIAAARSDGGQLWFQLYPLGGHQGADVLIDRAAAAGYDVLVVTVDTVVAGNRERDLRNRIPQPLRVTPRTALSLGPGMITRPRWLLRYMRDGMPTQLGNLAQLGADGTPLAHDEAMLKMTTEYPVWDDIARMRDRWHGPFVVKGVLTAEDAQRCLDIGADGIVVSNHGGRQLDSTPATIDVLAEVVAAVDGRIPVLVDGGIERGTDIIKAVALGATAVLVGRAYVWGLAYGGEDGVSTVLRLLRAELVRDMKLLGCPRLADLDPSWIKRASAAPSWLGAVSDGCG